MHPYRTHTCGELRKDQAGETVRISGWVHRKRDHGNLLFVDVRDHYGLTQAVIDVSHADFAAAEGVRVESVVTITGKIVERTADTINPELPTGGIELKVETFKVESTADVLPMQVAGEAEFSDEMRMTHRYLDLRREKVHANMVLRSQVISSARRRMTDAGFMEMQTPILTASSPEGARDYLVPSRHHPGQFYALPQAPQQFKQLLMVSGFDKYFQIAPCFRDEDARADRSPGEFYQLDMEMAYCTQDDVFDVMEPVLHGIFEEFGGERAVTPMPFPRIAYKDSMMKYGSDKPDLRNPLILSDVTEPFRDSGFGLFAKNVEKGSVVRAIPATGAAERPRSFFDKLNDWARGEGAGGLGYIIFNADGTAKGPIAKNLEEDRIKAIKETTGVADGDAVFFVCQPERSAEKYAGLARDKICEELGLLDDAAGFKFCWIVDYPMFELDEDTGKIEFSHNPFSMPQGGLEALDTDNPLDVLAYQYDIVCNGIELSSGAIRNHLPEIMYKAFGIAGYGAETVEKEFGGMLNAFKFGAPPHGGTAPGIDRMVMMLADEPNIREIIAFPMNQQAQDLLMQAPANVEDNLLRDLHLKVVMPPKVETKSDTKED